MTTTSAAQSVTIEVNGLALHYLDWGAPQEGAPTFVLLHGMSGSAASWVRVAEHFAGSYHVVALDQRGHGDSEYSPDHSYGTDDYVADLEGFIDALGVARVALLGHSLGGHNVIAYTSRHPDRVVAAIVNDMPPAMEWDREEIIGVFGDPDSPSHIVHDDVEAWMRAQNAPFTSEQQLRLSAETRMRAVDGGIQLKSDPWVSINWGPADLWDEFRAITRPTLLIRAGRSGQPEGSFTAQMLQDMDMAVDAARSITLEKSGHNTFADMEPEFLDIVGAFLAGHEA